MIELIIVPLISSQRIRKSARHLTFHCNCIRGIDVPHLIPAQHTAAGASSGGHVPTQESDEDTVTDVYLNMATLST
jgi:hypothetical protein